MKNSQKIYWERESLDKRRSPLHPVIKEYVVPRIEEIRKIVPVTKETKLLDVGGGNGFFSYYFDKICDTTCVDYSEKMIEINPIKKKFVMNANDLKFEDNSFDIVFCHAFLHHSEDIDKSIEEMKRVSRKYIIIIEPNRNSPPILLFSLLVKEERMALKFSLSFLKRLMESHGLRILSSFSFGLMVPNKTPTFLLPFLKTLNFKYPWGVSNLLITEKS